MLKSQPVSAEAWEWEEVKPMDVPIGDLQDIVVRRLRWIWQEAHLKPHDQNLGTLEYGDYYKVAAETADHTLYLMMQSPQTKKVRAAELTWIPPLPLSAGVFDWQEKPGRRGVYTSPQAREDTGFGSCEFVPPLDAQPLPPRQEVAKSNRRGSSELPSSAPPTQNSNCP